MLMICCCADGGRDGLLCAAARVLSAAAGAPSSRYAHETFAKRNFAENIVPVHAK